MKKILNYSLHILVAITVFIVGFIFGWLSVGYGTVFSTPKIPCMDLVVPAVANTLFYIAMFFVYRKYFKKFFWTYIVLITATQIGSYMIIDLLSSLGVGRNFQ